MASKPGHLRITERVATRLKLKQLRLLVAIAEHASILRAAQSLNISQPAATKLLQDLEAYFGVQLFDRTNRGAVPTDYGAALVRHGRLILAQVSHAAQELDDLAEGKGGRVVVGTLLAASSRLLPAAIARLRSARPMVSIAVREGTNDRLIPALQDGELDLVIGRLPEYRYREELVQEALYEEPVCIVAQAGHPLAGRRKLTLKDLSRCDWILPPPETTLRRQVDKEFLDAGLAPPRGGVESVSLLTNLRLLKITPMLAVSPYHAVAEAAERGELAILGYRIKQAQWPVGVSFRRGGRLSPAAEGFLQDLRSEAARLPPQAVL